ncbi:cytochrome aa3 quinol oxidase subunit IV [Rossellomorea vietnamensis]|uniref:Quinol oxidase subunit 4 n=1 Tax=Rossellomorea vietnamensis TaxID=218284 RepID=A0A5D4NPU3_9BACI|nr:cytochrome aa3 quinol oxidase subunit IV [Rossellomorea vietnamensis]TYS15909.1 cytochrome aa3 quinol oxidase subunit IV [Rossellomorea vietnamensis]
MEKTKSYPISHFAGFIMSLVLTFVAAWVALKTSLSFTVVLWVIGTLAVVQAGLQLFMFMHVNEGEDSKVQIINIAYAVFCAAVIVVGSIWVLTSGHAAH